MGITLTVQEGALAGQEFHFTLPVVHVGRTPENDLVLPDSGVSRQHLLIRQREDAYELEDLSSANGTRLNGKPARRGAELRSGDLLSLGPVVLRFALTESGETRVIDPKALAPGKRRTPAPGARAPTATALRRATPPAPLEPRAAPAAKPLRALSASERARFLRENPGPLGKLRLLLLEKPRLKPFVFGGAAVASLLVLAAALHLLTPEPEQVRETLGATLLPIGTVPDPTVYGLGPRAQVEAPDEVGFRFGTGSIAAVYTVAFEARNVEAAGEVEVSLNGVPVGSITPNVSDYSVEQRIRLPSKTLVPEGNVLLFDATAPKPNTDAWELFNIRMIVQPVAELSPEEATERAFRAYQMAEQAWSRKDIAAENRSRAWAQLQEALTYLETVEPKPELHSLATQLLRDVTRELDHQCGQVLLATVRAEEFKKWQQAVSELQSGLMFFPAGDHPCRAKLVARLEEYGVKPEY